MTLASQDGQFCAAWHSREAIAVEQLPGGPFRVAAVLLSVLLRPTGPTILFVKRAQNTSRHRGEIAFPGGIVESGESLIDAALREAAEETGLAPESVEVVGLGDDFLTITSFVITPVLGIVGVPPEQFVSPASEIELTFEVPLERLLDFSCWNTEFWPLERFPSYTPLEAMRLTRTDSVEHESAGWTIPVRFFPTEHGTIWGATAEILHRFLTRVYPQFEFGSL